MTEKKNDLLESLIVDFLRKKQKEEKRKIFWLVMLILFFVVCLYSVLNLFGLNFNKIGDAVSMTETPYAAVIRVNGRIWYKKQANAEDLTALLDKALKDTNAKGVISLMNSPGGSPVQSDYVYEKIMKIRKQRKDFKVIAVVEDLCASGCYYIASAANEILLTSSPA